MRFHYPFQKIVDLKCGEKSMAEWEYAAALGELHAEEERLALLVREREEAAGRLEEEVARPVPLARIRQMEAYVIALDTQIRSQTDAVRRAEEVVRERMRRLTDKMVDEKVWLNQREKAWERFRLEWQRREQKELDDLAAVKAARTARV
jgi:flagellar FliJ protein